MQIDKDLWRQLSREEKRELQKDLEKHFRLRLEVNDAIVKWFRTEHERDPSLDEVAAIRDRAMADLESKLKEELRRSKRGGTLEGQEANSAPSREESDEPYEKRQRAHDKFALSLNHWLKDFYDMSPEPEQLDGIRQYLMQRVEAMLGRAPRRDRLTVIRGGRNQEEAP